MIKIMNLTKYYEDSCIFFEYNTTIPLNKVTCILGESGRGKTTLLRILLGLEQKDGGSIEGMDGLSTSVVFQEDCLCEDFDAITNVAMVLPKSISKNEIRKHLEMVGLKADELTKAVKYYSGGMRRRVALVRSIMKAAEITFMDEPLKGLDGKTKEKVVGYIKTYALGKTMVIVTHDETEIQMFEANVIRL